MWTWYLLILLQALSSDIFCFAESCNFSSVNSLYLEAWKDCGILVSVILPVCFCQWKCGLKLPIRNMLNYAVLIFLIEPTQIPSQHEIIKDLPLPTKVF